MWEDLVGGVKFGGGCFEGEYVAVHDGLGIPCLDSCDVAVVGSEYLCVFDGGVVWRARDAKVG